MHESGSPISLTSTQLSISRCRNTSIGVPSAKCLDRLPGRRRRARTFRANAPLTTKLWTLGDSGGTQFGLMSLHRPI
jgi:hypothetical protein